MSSLSDYAEAEVLDFLCGVAATAPTAWFAQLHSGDPGESGTANVIAEGRQEITSWAGSGSVRTNGNELLWEDFASGVSVSHVSIHDASTAGNCLWKDALAASKSVAAGEDFRFPVGDLSVAMA